MNDPAGAEQVSTDRIMELLVSRIRTVVAPDPEPDDWAAVRFDEDLHADSLDLVEIIEGVERDLAEDGIHTSVSDEELLALRTVGDAASLLAVAARRG